MLLETARHLRECGHAIALVATNPSGPLTAGYDVEVGAFEALAAESGCPFIVCNRLEPATHLDAFTRSGADIGVSINWKTVISEPFIQSFPHGILNAHGGDLPRYRGNACQAWAILNRESRIGLCIHKMVPGELDSGDILSREYLSIDVSTKVTRVYEWMAERVPALFAKALELLRSDPSYVLEIQSRDPADALRCYPRTPEDGRIDWRKSAEDVVLLVNASNHPFAGAFFLYGDVRVTVWDAQEVRDGENFLAVPGQVLRIGTDGVEVACGRGKVRLWTLDANGHGIGVRELVRSVRDRLH